MRADNEAPCSKLQGILKAKLLRSPPSLKLRRDCAEVLTKANRIPTLLRPSTANRWSGFAAVLLPPSSPQQASSSLLRSFEEAEKSAGYSAKKNKFLRYLFSACILTFTVISSLFAQVAEQSVGEAKKNTAGGYNFYDTKTKKKAGYSKRRQKDIIYYDKNGNIVGTLKRDRRNKNVYNYYNPEGVKTGVLRSRVDGAYSYMDNQSGQIIEAVPVSRGDIGSLPPQTFVGRKRKE